MRRVIPVLWLLVACSSPASGGEATGPAALQFSGSVRVRQESFDDPFRPVLDASDDLFSIRSLLKAEWHRGFWKLGAELQDSRVYGADTGSVLTTGEVNTLEFVQAYATRDFASASVQAGRFTMNLGSRRLVAADDYRNTTSGYTGIRADFTLPSRTTVTGHFTLPQQRRPDDQASLHDNDVQFDQESFDLQLWGVLAAKSGLPGKLTAEIGYVGLSESDAPDRPTRNRELASFSGRIIRDPAPGLFDFELEGIVQTGRTRAGLAANALIQDVSAWFVHADAGWTFSMKGQPRLSLEYDLATGDDSDTSYGRFDTLFGMRRADLGPGGTYSALSRTNLQSLGLRIEATPTTRFDLFGTFRALWAPSSTDFFSSTGVRDPTGASSSFAGYQLDTRVRYWVIPQALRAEFNGVWLIKQGLLRDAPNATPYGDTIYLSAALTVSF